MHIWARCATGLVVLLASAVQLAAGGSGLNVVVVVNQASTNSIQLGNYYCERRGVPPQNVLRINWTGSSVNWSLADFESNLRAPLNAMLANRRLTNQIDYVLLSMDIPYRVLDPGSPINSGTNSTTSALFYGFKPDGCVMCPNPASCTLAPGSTNLYAGSEGIFRATPPINASSNSWLAMMLTSSNLAQAKAIVDRGVASDYSFPTQNVYLLRAPDYQDPFRSVRYVTYDDAIFDARIFDTARLVRLDTFPGSAGHQLGSQFGLVAFGLPNNLFAPGAMADNLTSFSGYIFENSGHTDALDYLNAGATASYGTVIEPCNYLEKFPSPRNYFYQARGFSVAESYYLSLTNPYQGLLVGEPLAKPFAVPPDGAWINLPQNTLLSGTTNLSLQFTAADETRPVQQVDLFVDGTFALTVTNLAPRQNNRLYVTINGIPTNYIVPAGATIKSVATGLAATLNTTSYSNVTKVAAIPRGDRIELRNLNISVAGENITVTTSNHIGTASALTTYVHASRDDFLDTIAQGYRSFAVTNTPLPGSFLKLDVTKTNGALVSMTVNNPPGNTDTSALVKMLVDAVNTNANLTGPDGVAAEEFFSYDFWFGKPSGEFNLRARSPGWPEAQIQAHLTGSITFGITPSATVRLDENLNDLRPRNHLYITAGLTNLPISFGFNTITQADGFHELTAVAYEGSHVRTQKRISQIVRIQNTDLSATFDALVGGTNTALEATLQFAVTANSGNISSIELFSTGGSLGEVLNQSSATFGVPAADLGMGLHPFYALVTRGDGTRYRTETKWIRIIDTEPPFALSVTGPAPTISWPATAGRSYEILSTTNLANPFFVRQIVTPTNSLAIWTETNNLASERFYRVRLVQ